MCCDKGPYVLFRKEGICVVIKDPTLNIRSYMWGLDH